MPDFITLTGLVATPVKALTTAEGLAITSFRLASQQRRFDRAQNKWVDSETNWFSVTAFRQLAANAAISVHQGDRIVVTGKVHIRDWEANGKKGITAEVDAEALGHDLSWGTAAFSRSMNSSPGESAKRPGAASGEPTNTVGWATPGVVDEQTGVIAEGGGVRQRIRQPLRRPLRQRLRRRIRWSGCGEFRIRAHADPILNRACRETGFRGSTRLGRLESRHGSDGGRTFTVETNSAGASSDERV